MSTDPKPRMTGAQLIALGRVCGQCGGTGVIFSPMNAKGRNEDSKPCPRCAPATEQGHAS